MKFVDRNDLNTFQDFDSFIQNYGDVISSKYQLLKEVVIDVVDIGTGVKISNNPFIDNEYFQDSPYSCDTEKMYVVDNTNLFSNLGFGEDEKHALIAHELGHINTRIIGGKENEDDEEEADAFACSLGLKTGLKLALQKLISIEKNIEKKDKMIQRMNNL